jgi:hypothetical protein
VLGNRLETMDAFSSFAYKKLVGLIGGKFLEMGDFVENRRIRRVNAHQSGFIFENVARPTKSLDSSR